MSDKQILTKEVSEIIRRVFEDYVTQFDEMTFSERAIVENVLIKLQWAFDKKFDEGIDDE